MTHTRVIFKLNYWFVFIGCFEVIYHVRNLLERKKNCPPLQQQQQHWTTFWFEKKLHSYWPIMLYYLSCTECSIRIRWILKALYFISANFHSRPSSSCIVVCNINMWQVIFFCIRIYVLLLWFERHLPFSYNEGAPARFLSLVLSSFGRNPLFQLLGFCFQHHSN